MGEPKLIYKVEIDESSSLEPVEVIRRGIEGYRHIIQSEPENIRQMRVAESLVDDPNVVFNDPLSLLLKDQDGTGETLLKEKFSNISDKVQLLSSIEGELEKHTKKRSLIDEIILVADEMLTNAVYNAPYADANKLVSGPNRGKPKEDIEEVHSADFFLGKDSEQLVVGCIDYYGKINIPKLLEKIKGCYDNSVADSMNMDKPGGAGIGTYIIYSNSTSMLVGVLPGEKTIFCSFFPLKGSNRQRASKPKSLYLVY